MQSLRYIVILYKKYANKTNTWDMWGLKTLTGTMCLGNAKKYMQFNVASIHIFNSLRLCFREWRNNWFLPSNVNLQFVLILIHFYSISRLSVHQILLKLLTWLCFVVLSSILYLLLNVQFIKICAKCFIFSDTLSFSFYDRNNAAGSVRIF